MGLDRQSSVVGLQELFNTEEERQDGTFPTPPIRHLQHTLISLLQARPW